MKWFLILLAVAAPVFAEDTVTQTTEQEVVVEDTTAPGKIVGFIDVRPTWGISKDEAHTENTLALGYDFNPDLHVGAVQYIDTNLVSPGKEGLGVRSTGTLVRAKFNNIWKNSTETTAFHYECRFYLPTTEGLQDEGSITTMRNYLKLSHKVSDTVTLTVMDLPILFFHSQDGFVKDGQAQANKAFENRVYLIADFALASNLSFSLPLFFHQGRHRNFAAGAANNDAWSFYLYSWPELTYRVDEHYSVGLSFYTGSFVQDDLSGFDLVKGFENGSAQFVFNASL